MSARAQILQRVRSSIEQRERLPHPGDFAGQRPEPRSPDPVDDFITMFEAAGGEVVRACDVETAAKWIEDFVAGHESCAIGAGVPVDCRPGIPVGDAAEAPIAISRGRGAVAETGSLVMDARDGRRTQLLAPTHVVLVERSEVHATLRDALLDISGDAPSAIGLHSGPSKSADIGQVMVKGVHGPGRLIALLVG